MVFGLGPKISKLAITAKVENAITNIKLRFITGFYNIPKGWYVSVRGFISVLCVLLCVAALQGQTSYVKPKAAVPGYSMNVEIGSPADLQYVALNLPNFAQVQRIRVSADVDIARVAAVLGKLDNLEEAVLQKYQGILSDDDLSQLEWLHSLVLYVADGKEDALLMNKNWSLIPGVTLVFQTVPDDYSFFKDWKACKRISLIAPYNQKEAIAALDAVATYLPNTEELGISLDRLYHLPVAVKSLSKLHRLNLIDNASWAMEKDVTVLGDMSIQVGYYEKSIVLTKRNGATEEQSKVHPISLHYMTADPNLLAAEGKFIREFFPVVALAEEGEMKDPSEEKYNDFAVSVPLNPLQGMSQFPKPITEPLLKDFSEGWFEFSGNNGEDRLFVADQSVVVMVPKGGMQTLDGKDWLGSYRFRLKVMNDLQRQMAYAPPLTLDSSGKKYTLSAPLVIDIEAFSGNQILKLKDGYFIEVRFVCAPDYNARFYAWDRSANRWKNHYDYDYNFPDDNLAPIDFYQFYAGRKTASIQTTVNLAGLEERIGTQGYNYLINPAESKQALAKFSEFHVARVGDKAVNENQLLLRRGRGVIGVRKYQGKEPTEKGVFEMLLYDKTELLFPELKPLRDYPLAFRTQWDKKEVMDLFFRAHKFWDFSIYQSGNQVTISLRCAEGLYQIELLQPKTRWADQPKKASREQVKFEKVIRQVLTFYMQKDHAFQVYQGQQFQKAYQQTAALALETGALPKGVVRNSFKIRSLGRFAWASPISADSVMTLNVVVADQGQAPIDVSQFVVGFKKPEAVQVYTVPLGSITPVMQTREFSLQLDPAKVSFFAAKDTEGKFYALSGDAFRKLEMKNNSLIYLPLQLAPEQQYTDESLRNLLNLPKKKTTP